MVKITYIEADGETRVIDVPPGQSVMEGAAKNGVRGIAADCGGNCACATCRIYVDPSWAAKLGQASDSERDMVEYSGDTEPNVRLSCQIKVTEALDGLVVRMPAEQHY
jgi:2Fe-2S ferredoxin